MKQPAVYAMNFASLAMLLAGCGVSSGVMPVGPDTWFLSEMRAEAIGGGRAAHDIVLAEAAGFCRQQGRSVDVLDLRPGGDPRGYTWPTAFGATFRCVGGAPVAANLGARGP